MEGLCTNCPKRSVCAKSGALCPEAEAYANQDHVGQRSGQCFFDEDTNSGATERWEDKARLKPTNDEATAYLKDHGIKLSRQEDRVFRLIFADVDRDTILKALDVKPSNYRNILVRLTKKLGKGGVLLQDYL